MPAKTHRTRPVPLNQWLRPFSKKVARHNARLATREIDRRRTEQQMVEEFRRETLPR